MNVSKGLFMKRLIVEQLVKWKENANRKPLILKGVRQCGKTYILKEFGKDHYENVAYFNFEQDKSLSKVFEEDFDINRIIYELSIISRNKIEQGKTLIIFDEIQECSNALTSLKYFNENGNGYHIACAGSLLGIALHKNVSFPVGKVDFITLYPMSFYEFLIAAGEENLYEYLLEFNEKSVSEALSSKIVTLLKQYYVIGGMPEVVDSWFKNHDIQEVERIQQQIISSYELDFAKHADIRDYPKLTAIWSSIPNQLSKPNNKFIFSQVKKGYRAKDLEDALEWLIDAGLVYKVAKIEKPFIPLSSYADNSFFKIYLCDVGLLRKMANVPAEVIIDSSSIYSEFKGAVTENFVLNELVKSLSSSLYYWTSDNSAEVDFVIQCGVNVVPIEVKAETNVKARSLSVYIEKHQPKYAIKASLKTDVGGEKIYRLPLYLIGQIQRFAK